MYICRYFYHRLAYLVDFEHQEILKSLLKGKLYIRVIVFNATVSNILLYLVVIVIVGSSLGRVKPTTVKLIFSTSLLSMQH